MRYFIMTRGPMETSWSKRGTIHARTSAMAARFIRRLFIVGRSTQVRALSAGYPANLAYSQAPAALAPRKRHRVSS